MGRTVGLIFKAAAMLQLTEAEMMAKAEEDAAVAEEDAAVAEDEETVAEGEKAAGGKRLTKAEVVEKLTEKGVEFDKKGRLEDLMKLLEGEGEEDGSNA